MAEENKNPAAPAAQPPAAAPAPAASKRKAGVPPKTALGNPCVIQKIGADWHWVDSEGKSYGVLTADDKKFHNLRDRVGSGDAGDNDTMDTP